MTIEWYIGQGLAIAIITAFYVVRARKRAAKSRRVPALPAQSRR
jgi:hypothetical protein